MNVLYVLNSTVYDSFNPLVATIVCSIVIVYILVADKVHGNSNKSKNK